MNPRIAKVIPKENHKLELTFTNGEFGVYDCTPLLNFGIFQELQNEDYFKQVSLLGGSVSWPNEQDICPDTLYLEAIKQ
jgi:hypothetical protein